MAESTVKYPASLVPVGQFAGKPALPLTRSVVVVGSAKHSRILLKSDSVSSVHTLLINSHGRWYFRDLVSRTHTILNGKSVREAALKNGDTITIGTFVFHVVAPEPKDIAPVPAPAALDITDAEMPVPIDTKTVLIGKRPGCEIRLLEEGVSTAHAVIFEQNGKHHIRDLYSRGGTFLNGQKIHQEELRFGDVVVVGETTIRYIPDTSVEYAPPVEETPGVLSEMPSVALVDEAMESHEVPLVAHEVHDEPVVVEPAAKSTPIPLEDEVEPTTPPVPVQKPVEILTNLPPGLSSLLGELQANTGRPVAKTPVEPATPVGPVESRSVPEALADDDDLVVPLRRREPVVEPEAATESPAEIEPPVEVEPSAIAPEVDEVRDAGDVEPVVEADMAARADDAVTIPVAAPSDEAVAEAEVAEAEQEDTEPAVANQPVSAIASPTDEEAAPADAAIPADEIDTRTVSLDHEPAEAAVDAIDEADEVELTDEIPLADEVAKVEAVESFEALTVETLTVAGAQDEVEDVSSVADTTAVQDTSAVSESPVDEPEAVADEHVAQDETVEQEELVALATGEPVAEVESPRVATSQLPPLDVKAFAEQVRRDFAEADAKQAEEPSPIVEHETEAVVQSNEPEVVAVEPETDLIAEPVAETTTEPEAEEVEAVAPEATSTSDAVESTEVPVDQEVVSEEAGPAAEAVSPVMDSPELRQLADLQAKIAAALRDPSSVRAEPVLPPDAPLVSDPASAMSAAARRARLIAEMLDQSEPIEEEAEREAQSITFEADESAEPPPIESIEEPAVAEDLVPIGEVAPVTDELVPAIDEVAPIAEEEAAPFADGVALPIESVLDTDTLPADLALGEESVPSSTADLLPPERAETYPAAPTDVGVEPQPLTLPSAVELSESPSLAETESLDLNVPTTPPAPLELDVPAAEALDVPLDLDDENELPLASNIGATPARPQDVFDQESIPSAAADEQVDEVAATLDEEISLVDEFLAPVDEFLAPVDEVRDAGSIVNEPVSIAPSIDPAEPVSESANDTLVSDVEAFVPDRVELVSDISAGEESSAIDVVEPSEATAALAAQDEPPIEIDQDRLSRALSEADVTLTAPVEVEAETISSTEDTVAAVSDAATTFEATIDTVEEVPAATLEIESVRTPADLVVQPDELAIEVDDSVAPIEADQRNAGEVIAVGDEFTVVNEEVVAAELETSAGAELEAADIEASALLESAPAAEVATVEPVSEAAEPSRVIVEAEEEEPLERQSRPLIAADEHLVDEELEELPAIAAFASAQPITESVESVSDELPESQVDTIEIADAVPTSVETAADAAEPMPVAESAPVVEAGAIPEPAIAEEAVVAELPAPIEPEIAAGTEPAAVAPIQIAPKAPTNVLNVNVPSLDDLQAEFDSAFEDALKMAEGQSFAKPAAEAAAPQPVQAEPAAEATKPAEVVPSPVKPLGRGRSTLDLKVPSHEQLQAEFNDAFADALKMAEGASFATPAAEAPKVVPLAPSESAKTDSVPSAHEAARPARPARKLPEFKLDESLLDQASNVSPLGGSAAASGPAAFMNLGGIGWIGDPTLDDFEIPESKAKPKQRRSRQRRPVGDLPPAGGEAPQTRAEHASELAADSTAIAPSFTEEDVTPVTSEAASSSAPTPIAEAPLLTHDDAMDLGDLASDSSIAEDELPSAAAVEAPTADLTEDVSKPDAWVSPSVDVTAANVAEAESAAPKAVPTILPPRPNRPRKSEAVVDQALSGSTSPFAAQELPLVDAFSHLPTPQLDEVLARLNTSGGAVKDHPPISQDRPIGEGAQVKVPASPFASQIPIAQPAGSVRRIRQRVSKLPLILGLMLGATLVTGALSWLIPVPRTVRGEVTFHNLNNVTELIRAEKQREILSKLGDLQRAAREQVEDFDGGGFLDSDRDEQFDEIVRNARFDPKHPELLVVEVPSNVNQSAADKRRLTALLNEFVKANKGLLDEQNRLKDEIREVDRVRAEIDTQMAGKMKRYDELGVIYDTGTALATQLKKVEKELATLDESRKQATREVDRLEAELRRLEKEMLSAMLDDRESSLRALLGVVEVAPVVVAQTPTTQPGDVGSELARLRRQRDDVAARLDRLTAARSPETAAARESFDRALDAFSQQVETARASLGDRPEVMEYVQSATRLQEQIRQMTDTLVRRQEQQITRLNELGQRLQEMTAKNKEERINGNPQIKEWMDDLSFQERRLNVAKESNATADEIGDIERNISFLKSRIAAQQELLNSPEEAQLANDLEDMIETTKKDMAIDRQRNEALLGEVQGAFQSRQPVLEQLPAEQRQVAEGFTERLAQINLARQRYTDSLAAVAGTDESLIADAKTQIAELDKSIAMAETRVHQDALAQAQVMEKRTEVARQVDELRSKVLAARTERDSVEKQYYDIVASRDALLGKIADRRSALVERDEIKQQLDAADAKRTELIVRKQEADTKLKFAIVPLAIKEPDVLRVDNTDPRFKYFGLSVLAIVAVGGTLMMMEYRNRIPVPPAPDESHVDQGPLSHTPTVA